MEHVHLFNWTTLEFSLARSLANPWTRLTSRMPLASVSINCNCLTRMDVLPSVSHLYLANVDGVLHVWRSFLLTRVIRLDKKQQRFRLLTRVHCTHISHTGLAIVDPFCWTNLLPIQAKTPIVMRLLAFEVFLFGILFATGSARRSAARQTCRRSHWNGRTFRRRHRRSQHHGHDQEN